MNQTTTAPSLKLVAPPGSVSPHPASLNPEFDKYLPKTSTNWTLFNQVVTVIDATTTDRKQLAHNMKLYHWWSIWNQLVFRSSLQPNFLSVESAEYGKWLGVCCLHPVRKIAISLAAYSARKSLDEEGGAGHHGVATDPNLRPEQFRDLKPLEWNACLVLLHEMMHDCLWAALGKHSHECMAWGQLCNMVGRDVLGVPRNYTGLIQRRLTVKDENGNTVMQPHADGKCDENGNIIMKPKRQIVWEPTFKTPKFPNDFNIASATEMRCFPYLEGSSFIEMHTATLTTGKAVKNNGGNPVIIPPQF